MRQAFNPRRQVWLAALLTLCGAAAQADDWPAEAAIAPGRGFEMVRVSGGCYVMGDFSGRSDADERPRHPVCVSDFSIGKFPVTQYEWIQVMGRNPSAYSSCAGGLCPVENVNWNEVQDFIKRLNARGSARYRLPTEAEWEYAARSGGRDERWSGTDDASQLGDYAWFAANALYSTHRVGTKRPNALGLHDMTGNVWQWTADRYAADYYAQSPQQDPGGPPTGERRVLRGGFWGSLPDMARTTRRIGLDPQARSPGFGLRLVQMAP